jgi:hypothetical protein
MNTFATMLEIRLRPWNVSNPNSPASIGIGALTLLNAARMKKQEHILSYHFDLMTTLN